MEQSTNTFNYEPLDVDKREIRLIVLEPAANFDDNISCKLFHSMLQSSPSYEALSYFWGDPAITLTISLHQQPFNVTTNLECALRHLRQVDAVRTLWIDALCINQLDLRERAAQVAIMGDIYQCALRTVMWLGPGSTLSPVTLRLVRHEYPPTLYGAQGQVEAQLLALNRSDLRTFVREFVQILVANEVWERI